MDGKEQTPEIYAQFDIIPEINKKHGAVPEELNDIQRNKLRLGLKVGIFYFQYTLLKHTLETDQLENLMAPRGHIRHRENEPDDPEARAS